LRELSNATSPAGKRRAPESIAKHPPEQTPPPFSLSMYGSLELPRLMALPAATRELSPNREMLSAISLSLSKLSWVAVQECGIYRASEWEVIDNLERRGQCDQDYSHEESTQEASVEGHWRHIYVTESVTNGAELADHISSLAQFTQHKPTKRADRLESARV
jgi:hypothetical protein